ncbi:hypothetical protein D3Z45_07540 [Lachnospiraceae bacterium]|nr:hypothetical protein [Lachnospiraceae bacterium]
MKSMENILKDGTEKDLRETKAWFVREDLRLKTAQRELEDKQRKFEEEKKSFEKEMKQQQHKMDVEKGRLEQENRLLEQKLKILQQGYIQLDEDRHRLQREKDKFNSKRSAYAYESQGFSHHSQVAEMMFSGVNSYLTLKKRYKDLMKMFHPDNVTGDHEMVQIITREYEELKRAYEMGSRAR